jgi:hypothetical protein
MTPKEMRDDEAQTHSKETKIQVVRKEMTNPKYNKIEKHFCAKQRKIKTQSLVAITNKFHSTIMPIDKNARYISINPTYYSFVTSYFYKSILEGNKIFQGKVAILDFQSALSPQTPKCIIRRTIRCSWCSNR